MRPFTIDLPSTIENGAGEALTFERVVEGPNGARLEVTNRVAPGAGPPMHVHYRQTECLRVEEGRLAYQRPGEDPVFVEAGGEVIFPPGDAHRFWNAGDGPLRCSGWIEPPDNFIYFLTAIYESIAKNGGGRPDPFDAAFLLRRYRTEFGMLEIPAFVQRFVFPLLVPAGRVLGRYRRYHDAPDPVGR